MAWSAIKRRQLEDGFGSFEFQFQTQKRKRSSRVSETQRNVAVEEKSTVGLPLCMGLASSATKNANQESEEGFDEICQTQKRKRSSRVSETQRNVAVEEKSTVGLPLCMGLASSATKNANQESEEGFDEICQTQKRKRSSRVSETQRNVAVEEKSTVGLPLCMGLASSATKNANQESEEGFDEICQTQKRKRSSRVSETQRNVAVEEKSTVGLPLCMGLASSATKNANQESEEGFDEICQTQKRKRSSRVSETQRNENSTVGLPLRKAKGLASSASKGTLDCSKVLDSLMNLSHASYFNKPVVDPVAENLPGYFEEIWRPMDLGTVKSKLERGVYSSADGFAADVRLIFSNAFRYFTLGSRNLAAAKHLSGVFETQWKEAEEKMSKTACPPPTPPLPKRRPNGKSSSACRVLMQSQGVVGVSDSHSVKSTKDDDLGTLVHHAMYQATDNLSPCKARRIQSLKMRFSGTIRKANKILKGLPDSPPRRKLMHRMERRESARHAVLNMEKSVQFENPLKDLKELEILCGCGSEKIYLGLPLKHLGLYLKEDDELQGQDEEAFLNGDWEEGEICWQEGDWEEGEIRS
ncbi:bromodomain adjacent to zinc finger domain protein 1A-like isoform X3 [Prunus avium]|uniref:Bromodomain adjacent to zinc finger domain protein 1A-like isoform X3 n=1 Tax=Prunus avium TaxID=42229 RepID=A0A6P5S6W7_PRUAV|nr:bromodomain adjacent to zinc finger domain protein 1A-like isoform X3 [Prunus avium]